MPKETLNDSQKLAIQQAKEQVMEQKMQDAAARHGGTTVHRTGSGTPRIDQMPNYTDRRPAKIKWSEKK